MDPIAQTGGSDAGSTLASAAQSGNFGNSGNSGNGGTNGGAAPAQAAAGVAGAAAMRAGDSVAKDDMLSALDAAAQAGGNTENAGQAPEKEAGPVSRQDAGQDGKQEAGTDTGAEAKQEAAQDADGQPIKDFSKVDLGLPKDVAVDDSLLEAFGKTCVELGLTPKQARGLAAMQIAAIRASREEQLASGLDSFKRTFGRDAQTAQRDALALVANIDRQMGDNRFSRAIEASGAGVSGDFVIGLAKIAAMLSEDGIGAGHGPGVSQMAAETVEQGIANAFAEARRR